MKRAHTRVSLLPVFAVLVVALAVLLAPWKFWPSLVSSLVPGKTKQSALSESARVWVNSRSGFYYCSDSTLFGKITPGSYMTQGEALQKGYSPAAEKPCQDDRKLKENKGR